MEEKIQEAHDIQKIRRELDKALAEQFERYVEKEIAGEDLSLYRYHHKRRVEALEFYYKGLLDIVIEEA